MRIARLRVRSILLLVLGSWMGMSSLHAEEMATAAQLHAMTARFAPVDIQVDLAALPANEQAALAKLIEASRYIDALFMRQRSARNGAWLLQLANDSSPLGKAR